MAADIVANLNLHAHAESKKAISEINEEMILAVDNVTEIVRDGLCTGCGVCAGVCPTDAIIMRISKGLFLPEIEQEKCNGCRICVRCCPGYSVDFEELNFRIFRKQPEDARLGNFLGCYVGHANDADVRSQASSGGVAPRLLSFALEKGMIDGALVVGMCKDQPLVPKPFIARTREEVVSASKSKYCPVSIDEALRYILENDGRFAVVGLPCHIHGIRKAERIFKILEKRIVLRIGLLCSRTANFMGTEFVLKKMGISKEQVIELRYRGKGWPGAMLIRLTDGSNSSMPCIGWNAYWPIFSSFFFTPMRCIMCPDHTNELADISLGDAWLPELKHKRFGESLILTRTKDAENLLARASSAGAISIRMVEFGKVKQSQAEPLKFKKDDMRTRLAILKSIGHKVPDFGLTSNSYLSFMAFLRTFYAYFNIRVSANERLRSLLISVPFPLFRVYYGIRKLFSLI